LLVLDGAHRGADHKRLVELGVMCARQVLEKYGGPGAAITAILRQVVVHGEGWGFGDGDEETAGDAVGEIGVVFDTFQEISLGALVLADQRIARASQGRGIHHFRLVYGSYRAGRGSDGALNFDGGSD